MEAEKFHSLEVRDPGKPVIQFQYKSEGLRTRKTSGVRFNLSMSPKAGENRCTSSKSVRQREQIPPNSAFLLHSGLQQIR